jgi:sulfotransferase
MDKKIFFLSGLPRSGSTLLASLISQNPDFTVTPTSPLLDLLCFIDESFTKLDKTYTYDKPTITNNIYKAVVPAYYEHIKTKYILDKHRGHPRNVIPHKMFVTDNPRIICTVRPIPDVITSYITLIEKNKQDDNFVDNHIRKIGLKVNTSNRAEVLWKEYISDPYKSLIHGLSNHREHIHLVDYDNLVKNPNDELFKIYEFLNVEKYKNHQFKNIKNNAAEDKDFAWGLDNLHNIRPALEKQSVNPKDVLGPFLVSKYSEFNIKWKS